MPTTTQIDGVMCEHSQAAQTDLADCLQPVVHSLVAVTMELETSGHYG